MNKPLIISDCDEVLLYMIAPFRDWLGESEGVEFKLQGNNFGEAMRWKDSGERLEEKDIWRLLRGFFDTEMHRQTPITGAVDAMATLADHADVVVLTNLADHHREMRFEQLADHGIGARVFTNQGPKGPALKQIIAEYSPSRTIFIDDLAQHHRSAREHLDEITTLHFCGEPSIAPHVDCAHISGHAEARIDTWDEALPWLLDQLNKEPRA